MQQAYSHQSWETNPGFVTSWFVLFSFFSFKILIKISLDMGSVYGLHIVLNAVKKHFQGFSLLQFSSLTLVPKSTIHF